MGHYGPALALHARRDGLPLWALFLAVQAVDVLWAIFIFAGVEHARIVPGFTECNPLDLYDMPYTHGLAMTAVWAALGALVWTVLGRSSSRVADAVTMAAAIASHFVGDLLVHVRDLPISLGGGEKLGLGLWRHRDLALVVELAFFALPALEWLRRSRSQQHARRRVAMIGGMALALIASYFVPAPAAVTVMSLTELLIAMDAAVLAAWASPD